MSNRISGNSRRNYIGTRASQPPNITFNDHRPNEFDRFNYEVGDLWLYTDPTSGTNYQELYYLASLANDGVTTIVGKQAKWVPLVSGSSDVSSFQLDVGTAESDAFGVVNLFAGTNTNTVGDNLTTMRINLNDSILLPATTGPNAGVIALGTTLANDYFLHNYGAGGATDLNTFIGRQAANFILTGSGNTACGSLSLALLGSGFSNTVIGRGAGFNIVDGFSNTAAGVSALLNVNSGNNNIGIGLNAGSAFTTESNNIAIGNPGVALDSGTIRIGTAGTHTSAYMAGVTGVTNATFSPAKVMAIGTDGQLGETELISSDATIDIVQVAPGQIDLTVIGGGAGSSNPFAFSYVQDTGATGVQASSYLQLGDYVALTKIFDVGNNVFPGNGLGTGGFAYFTAPVTGKYYLEMYLQLTQQPTFGYGPKIVISSPSKTYQSTPSVFDVGDRYPANVAYTLVVDMDMGATAQFGFATTAGTVGFDGNTVFNINSTRISGFLLTESAQGGNFTQPFMLIQAVDTVAIGSNPSSDYFLGSLAVLNYAGSYDVGFNTTPGDGIGGAATFTAQATGRYSFTINAILSFFYNGSPGNAFGIFFQLYINGVPNLIFGNARQTNNGDRSFYNATVNVSLAVGNVVTFDVVTTNASAGATVTVKSNSVGGFVGQTFVCGHRLA